MCSERIIVHRSIADKFREALKTAINNALDGPDTELLAINPSAIAKNKALVRDAVSKGGRILLGEPAAQVASDIRMRGVVVENVTKDMAIYEDK